MTVLKCIGSRTAVLVSLLLSSILPYTLAANSTIPSSSKIFSNDVSIAVNVPEGTGLQDLYFSFEAPASGHNWAAFGIGSQMDQSLIFVVYRSADNQGAPTLSPRIGGAHTMPVYTSAVNTSILENSSVDDDKFVVNFHCTGCRSWGNASVDVTSTSASFFYALGPAETLESDDKSAQISQHSDTPVIFALNLQAATGANGVPTLDSTNTTQGTDNDDDNDSDSAGISPGIAFHAFVMCLAFTIIYPAGYLFLRLFEKVWLHWGIQSFGVLLVFLGTGSGIAVSVREQLSPKLHHPHQIVGILTFIVVLSAWTLGLIGHMMYKKKGIPSPLMKAHRIAGPSAMLLGTINACIGLWWAGAPKAIVGYLGFNLLVLLAVGGLVFLKKKRNMRKQAMTSNAAANFREGNAAYSHIQEGNDNGYAGYEAPPPAYGQNVPMQTFGQSSARQQPQHGEVQYYNVQPNK